jgi:NAD(P)H-flavin reductase
MAGFGDIGAAASRPDPMVPRFLTVRRRVRETADVATLEIALDDADAQALACRPGQFNMLYAFGVGEIPVSVSGDPAITDRVTHTVRAVGAVSKALINLKVGDAIGLRGPFGSSWPVEEAVGSDALIVAGGIGLFPLRPVIYHLLRRRADYGRVALLCGARTLDDLLFRKELYVWRRTPDFQLRVTLDRADRRWSGDVGYVTGLLPKARIDPEETVAMVCGPEIMIRATTQALEDIGVSATRIFVSLERNMKCAIGLCGHCQFGPHFLCKDGPVYRYDRVRDFLAIREL